MMGGKEVGFLCPSGSGENTLVLCERGDYAADLEIASGVPRPVEFPERLGAPEEITGSDVTTIEALPELLGIDPAATSKAMPVTREDGTVVLALVRGDDRLSEEKLGHAVPGARLATDEEIRAAFGADPSHSAPRRVRRRGGRGRGAARGPVRRGREQDRLPPPRRRARPRLRGPLR